MCCINLDDCSAGTYIRMYVRRYVLADVYSMYLFLFMYVHNMYVRTCIHLYVCHIVGNIWGGGGGGKFVVSVIGKGTMKYAIFTHKI